MSRRICLLDTSLILTLATANRLDIALSSTRYAWRITPLIRGELRQRETRIIIDDAIASSVVSLAELDLAVAVEREQWAKWSALVDPGEAEAIALAVSRNWLVALEDRQAQRALNRHAGAGRWINCVNLLLDAVDDDLLLEADADIIFRGLDCYGGYEKRGVRVLKDLRHAAPPP